MSLVIVTGMSGAGKSQAVNALEDIGYYCVDNVPPSLLQKFAELPAQSKGQITNIALVTDMRSRDMFADFDRFLRQLDEESYAYKVLFLDCDDRTLITRYKETRRRHPLLGNGSGDVQRAIAEERQMLSAAKGRADYIIDTSLVSASQLNKRVREVFRDDTSLSMHITCMSFGFKNGVPVDSDLVFDVRCLPNPFYVKELREHTGQEACVRDYVLGFPQAQNLIPKLLDLMDYLIPLYQQEGKSQLVISMGCTGGKHRSVTFAELLAKHLEEKGLAVNTLHRDIER